MRLYDGVLSGNCYKVRLFLGLIGREYEVVPVDLAKGENRTPEFLALNPRGQIPVLVDDEVTLWDSVAILAYLARRYAADWFPEAPRALGEVMQWLAFSENECLFGMARARAALKFGRPFDLAAVQAYARAGLAVLEGHLARREWLAAGAAPTISDVACYPYVALCPEGEVALDPYPAVGAWLARVQALPGYRPMPGIAAA